LSRVFVRRAEVRAWAPVNSAQWSGLRVEVAYCPSPGWPMWWRWNLPAGALLSDAVLASGLLQRHGLALKVCAWASGASPCEPTTLLRDRDRVEIYRPLTVDPKEARRLRYKRGRAAKD
jgi:putative ubiquitin-RnfH superfamily antitoxin RatB of RatAB toxin-antitoxin module